MQITTVITSLALLATCYFNIATGVAVPAAEGIEGYTMQVARFTGAINGRSYEIEGTASVKHQSIIFWGFLLTVNRKYLPNLRLAPLVPSLPELPVPLSKTKPQPAMSWTRTVWSAFQSRAMTGTVRYRWSHLFILLRHVSEAYKHVLILETSLAVFESLLCPWKFPINELKLTSLSSSDALYDNINGCIADLKNAGGRVHVDSFKCSTIACHGGDAVVLCNDVSVWPFALVCLYCGLF